MVLHFGIHPSCLPPHKFALCPPSCYYRLKAIAREWGVAWSGIRNAPVVLEF
jgi:hypothetical protein